MFLWNSPVGKLQKKQGWARFKFSVQFNSPKLKMTHRASVVQNGQISSWSPQYHLCKVFLQWAKDPVDKVSHQERTRSRSELQIWEMEGLLEENNLHQYHTQKQCFFPCWPGYSLQNRHGKVVNATWSAWIQGNDPRWGGWPYWNKIWQMDLQCRIFLGRQGTYLLGMMILQIQAAFPVFSFATIFCLFVAQNCFTKFANCSWAAWGKHHNTANLVNCVVQLTVCWFQPFVLF